jgi:hypothetical protein
MTHLILCRIFSCNLFLGACVLRCLNLTKARKQRNPSQQPSNKKAQKATATLYVLVY